MNRPAKLYRLIGRMQALPDSVFCDVRIV